MNEKTIIKVAESVLDKNQFDIRADYDPAFDCINLVIRDRASNNSINSCIHGCDSAYEIILHVNRLKESMYRKEKEDMDGKYGIKQGQYDPWRSEVLPWYQSQSQMVGSDMEKAAMARLMAQSAERARPKPKKKINRLLLLIN